MAEPEPPAAQRFQVLSDPTGHRRRRLAIAGRVATTALGLWLVVLILGGLGLQPLAGLPIVGDLGTGVAAPPTLPTRVRTAVAKHTTVAPATAPGSSETTTGSEPTSTAPKTSRPKTNPSTTAPGQTRTPPGQTKTGSGPPASTPGTTPGANGKGNDKVPGANDKAKKP